jgi:TonB family protein
MIEARRYLQGQVADGRFPLIQYLGGTEHSAVFLTECADAENKRAAIKLIPAPPRNTEPQLTRWRLAARFSHPHLLRLFDAGRCTLDDADMLYVVMEYAEENLAEILTQRPLSPAETSELLGPVLEALGYIHGRGFVHGHIQPSNIVAIGDQVKLSSDRICRIGEPAERRNGSARYSAPECAAGDLSPASDVWSLGITLVECLTEHLPELEDGNRGTVTLPAELPAPFLELARHCLTKPPQRRWNVSDLKARLQRNSFAVEEVAAPVPVPAPVVRPEPPSKRRYPVALTALGLAAATIVLGMAALKHSSHAQQAPAVAMESPATQPNVVPASEQPSPKAQPQLQAPPSNSESSAVSEVDEAASATPAALHSPPAGELAQGSVLHRALPNVPRYASETISGTVRVRVRVEVDPSGNVAGAEFDSAGPSRYFARLSMGAARAWKFRPPGVNARTVPSEWLIRFGYTSSDITATAVERNP